jgi:alpha-tubulin suppressor-like RCC1 family protein
VTYAGGERVVRRFPDLGPRWTIVEELGRGGTSTVFRAVDRERGHDVAIKVVSGRVTDDPEQMARLEREARTVAALAHPNIVGVYALERTGGGFALVMQLVAGRTLRALLAERGPLPVAQVLGITRDVGRALSSAHDQGIIHRDVKPGNIFIEDAGGRALLADFGIARALDADVRITQTGVAIGTPAYMAPEQVDGAAVDGRSDVYSLALVMWEMLAGHHPWPRATLYEVIYRQKHVAPPPIRNVRGDVPAGLEDAIAVGLRKDPVERWGSAREFVAAAEAAWGATNQWRAPSPAAVANWRHSGDEEAPTIQFRRADVLPEEASPPVLPAPLPAAALPAPAPARTPVLAEEARAWAEDGLEERGSAWRRWGTRLAVAAVLAAAVVASLRDAGRSDDRQTATRQAVARRMAEGGGPGAAAISSAAGALAADSVAIVDSLATLAGVVGPGGDSLPAVLTPEIDRGFDTAAAGAAAAPEEAPPQPAPVVAAAPPLAAAIASDSAVAAADPGDSVPPAAAVAPLPPLLTPEGGGVVAGGEHSCAIASGATAVCWGSDSEGQLGGEASGARGRFTSVATPPLAMLAAGIAHTCGVTTRGEAYCWGSNTDGQLGAGVVSERGGPTRVAGERAFARIAAGRAHTCAATAGGAVYCWGENGFGQLGDATTRPRSAPTPVRTRARAARVALGWNHSCLLTPDGDAYCWGSNGDGQLGDGSRVVRLAPARVDAPARFVAVSAGSSHTCGVDEEGAAYCWGRNDHGQLGTGSTEGTASPVRVRSPEAFTELAAGSVHTCARTRSRELYCWGRNTFGQVGDGTRTDRPIPVRVTALPPVISVDARGAHTCAETTDGVYCWGYNAAAQAGDPTRAHRLTPARVSLARGGGGM